MTPTPTNESVNLIAQLKLCGTVPIAIEGLAEKLLRSLDSDDEIQYVDFTEPRRSVAVALPPLLILLAATAWLVIAHPLGAAFALVILGCFVPFWAIALLQPLTLWAITKTSLVGVSKYSVAKYSLKSIAHQPRVERESIGIFVANGAQVASGHRQWCRALFL